VAIDRPSDEGVEKQRATDAPPPPPPPDRPGEEGFPSRAESRAFAAAAIDRIRERDHAGERTDTSAPDAAGEDRDDPQDDRQEQSTDRERDAGNDDEDAPTESDADHEPVDEGADAEGSNPAKPSGDAADSAYLDDLQPRGDLSGERPEPFDPEADRMGARIIDEGDNKGSLLERLRGEYYDVIDDFNDTVKGEANRFKDLFDRPPTGSHTVDRPPDNAVIDTPHHGVNTGEAVTAVLTTGIFVGELFYRAVHGRMRRTKEDDDARD
jgi:hypothetical protein